MDKVYHVPFSSDQIEAAIGKGPIIQKVGDDSYWFLWDIIFPTWEEVLEAKQKLMPGRIITQDGQPYRVAQEVTPQADQAPHDEGMLAIYRPIDEGHDGTLADPIPWLHGMDCVAGNHYSYNGAVYQVAEGGSMIPCTWPPDTDGVWQWVKIKEEV